jgi:mono/diheme cytochrome c family protein
VNRSFLSSSSFPCRSIAVAAAAVGGSLLLVACTNGKQSQPAATPAQKTQTLAVATVAPTNAAENKLPSVQAPSPEQAGRYLVTVGGCNDCHTPGFAATGGKIPETLWLTGNGVGFRGPWGTTYASNLRKWMKNMKPDDFVTIVKARHDKPPMPWSQLHGMSDTDLRAVYAFVRSLPVAGPETPPYVPPGKEPTTPYVDMIPKNLPTGGGDEK